MPLWIIDNFQEAAADLLICENSPLSLSREMRAGMSSPAGWPNLSASTVITFSALFFPVLPGISECQTPFSLPTNENKLAGSFRHFCFCLAYATLFYRVKKSAWEDQLTNQKAIVNHQPIGQIVKRKSNANHAWALKVHIYLIVIQILPFIDWTCCPERSAGLLDWGADMTLTVCNSISVEWRGSPESAFSHFVYGDTEMGLKCSYGTLKMQYLRKSLQWVWPLFCNENDNNYLFYRLKSMILLVV